VWQTDRPDGRTDGRTIAYSALSICCRALKQLILSTAKKNLFKKQIRTYYRSGTGILCCIGDRRFVFTHQVAELFCMKWRRGRHSEIMTSNYKSFSVNLCVLREEYCCQISSRSDLKRWSLRLFWKGRPNNNNKNKMSSDMRSVPDLTNPIHTVGIKEN